MTAAGEMRSAQRSSKSAPSQSLWHETHGRNQKPKEGSKKVDMEGTVEEGKGKGTKAMGKGKEKDKGLVKGKGKGKETMGNK